MFRKMRRAKQELSITQCKEILKEEWRGILSLKGDDDYPYGVPMNFYYDENDNAIYFHSAKEGHKVDAIKNHDKASFCVYKEAGRKENHWSLNFKSVIVFGRITIIDDRAVAKEKIKSLALKYFPKDATDELNRDMSTHFEHAHCIKLEIKHVTGKLINES